MRRQLMLTAGLALVWFLVGLGVGHVGHLGFTQLVLWLATGAPLILLFYPLSALLAAALVALPAYPLWRRLRPTAGRWEGRAILLGCLLLGAPLWLLRVDPLIDPLNNCAVALWRLDRPGYLACTGRRPLPAGTAPLPGCTTPPASGQWQVWVDQRTVHDLSPSALAIDGQGTVYTAGFDHVSKLSPTGEELASWGEYGWNLGDFRRPRGIAVDRTGTLVIADSGNDRVQRLSATGDPLGAWGTDGFFRHDLLDPDGVAVNGQGQVFILDSGHDRIEVRSPMGQVLTRFGSAGTAPGQFQRPGGLALDRDGHLWVADTGNTRLQELSSSGQVLAVWDQFGCAGGVVGPQAVAVGPDGTLAVTDAQHDRVAEFSPDSRARAAWGSRGTAAGQFSYATGIAFGPDGALYVADSGNHRIQRLPTLGGP